MGISLLLRTLEHCINGFQVLVYTLNVNTFISTFNSVHSVHVYFFNLDIVSENIQMSNVFKHVSFFPKNVILMCVSLKSTF